VVEITIFEKRKQPLVNKMLIEKTGYPLGIGLNKPDLGPAEGGPENRFLQPASRWCA
jgi:hypothetical protein